MLDGEHVEMEFKKGTEGVGDLARWYSSISPKKQERKEPKPDATEFSCQWLKDLNEFSAVKQEARVGVHLPKVGINFLSQK